LLGWTFAKRQHKSGAAVSAIPSSLFPKNMKRQLRPFAVEIKGARQRAVTPSSFRPQPDRLSSSHGGLWGPTFDTGLATKPKSFSREAEALFQIASADRRAAPPDEASLVLPTVEPRRPRILPDLRQVASDDAPATTRAPRRRKPIKPKQVRKRAEQDDEPPETPPHAEDRLEPSTAAATPLREIRRKLKRVQKKLPRGQRWKQRRLPPVCWK
jgi:hypothetical protein